MPRAENLDATDYAILELLRQDARRTVRDIATHVNLSPGPVTRRIDRLERTGVITGYSVAVDHTKVGPTLEAFTELRLAGNTDVQDVLDGAMRLPEVLEAFTTAGDPDALLRLRVDDVMHLQRVVSELRRNGSVTGTKTLIVLERRVSSSDG